MPHFEKMSYDNSELLKNYLHGYQVTGNAALPRSRRRHHRVGERKFFPISRRGGFYASQDADQTLDDDGDYFTWTLAEVRAVLTPEEARVIEMYYDIGAARRNAPQPGEKCPVDCAKRSRTISRELNLSEATRGDFCSHAQRAKCSPRAANAARRRPSMKRSTSAGTRCSFPRIWKPRAFSAVRIAARSR